PGPRVSPCTTPATLGRSRRRGRFGRASHRSHAASRPPLRSPVRAVPRTPGARAALHGSDAAREGSWPEYGRLGCIQAGVFTQLAGYLQAISGPRATTLPPAPQTAEILGIPLAISDYEQVLDWMDAMIAAGAHGYLTAAAVNLVMSAQEEP